MCCYLMQYLKSPPVMSKSSKTCLYFIAYNESPDFSYKTEISIKGWIYIPSFCADIFESLKYIYNSFTILPAYLVKIRAFWHQTIVESKRGLKYEASNLKDLYFLYRLHLKELSAAIICKKESYPSIYSNYLSSSP